MTLKIQKILVNCNANIIAIIKIILLSKLITNLPKVKSKSIIYLANGPSLNEQLERILNDNGFDHLMVSNYFYKSDLFLKLKPKYYTICDPGFQNIDSETHPHFKEFYIKLFSLVEWKMYLFIPYLFKKKIELNLTALKIKNNNITIVYYNSVNFNGDTKLLYKLFDKKLGMPSPTTVAVPSIILAIYMGFKKINILGIDINMHQNIIVDKDNILKIRDLHFYNDEKMENLRPFYKETVNKTTFTSSEIFLVFHKMLHSFDIISKYAKLKNVEIINYSKNSFLDQFKKI